MSILAATFSSGQVTAAARITNAALQTWVRRGLIIGHKDGGVDMPGKPGIRRTFSFFNLVEVATGAALVNAGTDLRQAFRAANHYAHAGSYLPGLPRRLPSLPFPGARLTLIGVAADRSAEVVWEPKTDAYIAAAHALGNPEAFALLNASAVFERAMVAIGQNPHQVKREAYKGEGEE